jgi:hypothetical protein
MGSGVGHKREAFCSICLDRAIVYSHLPRNHQSGSLVCLRIRGFFHARETFCYKYTGDDRKNGFDRATGTCRTPMFRYH